MQTVSQTEKVLAALKEMPKGSTFDTRTLLNQLDGVSVGALTGLMSRLKKQRGITVHSSSRGPRGRLHLVYKLENPNVVSTRTNPKKKRKPPTARTNTPAEGIMSLLSNAVSAVGKLRTELSQYSTDELLHELKRRAG